MSKNNRWFSRFVARRAKQNKPIAPREKSRRLVFEVLEPRRVLSAPGLSLATILAQRTPSPHPSGDVPADISQLVTLTTYTQGFVPPDMPGIPEIHAFVVGLQQIFTDIANNSAARPAYWGEYVAGTANQYRLHLDGNGMLVTSWTINWGDGSDPQVVSPAPWVVHQYAQPGNYTVCVTAQSPDGSFTAVGGDPPIPDQPPTLHVAGPQTVAQGATFALDNLVSISSPDQASVLPDTNFTGDYSYNIDFGDGSVPITGAYIDVISAGGNNRPFMGALRSDTPSGPLTHVFTDPGTYDVNVTVTNSNGVSDTQTIPVTVVELAPTISLGDTDGPITDGTCNEGTQVSLGSSYTTTLTDPVAYNWQITDSSGDTVFQSTDPSPTYTFTAADIYTVSLVMSVNNVQSAPATATITVNNVAPSFVGSIPSATVSLGQTYNLSAAFTDLNPNDTHTVTVDWGDSSPLDTAAQLTEETAGGAAVTPGTITDSYTYSAATTYTGTVTLMDSEGLPQTANFSVHVVSAAVALTDFAVASGSSGEQLQVKYTVANANAAPFNINIYTSQDGTTPDQLLQTVPVTNSSDLTETSGTPHSFAFTPQFDDIQANYHLIAVIDANSTNDSAEFDGGLFYAQSVTASPSQDILYVFGSTVAKLPVSGEDTVSVYGAGDSPANSVVFDTGTSNSSTIDYSAISPAITGVHVRGEAGNDDFEADNNVTLPLWLFGGSGTSTLKGGEGNNLILGGSGPNVIHSSSGPTTPQTEDDTDSGNFSDSGSWSSPAEPVADAFNGNELYHAATSGDHADWTFGNLDPTAYYDVYVTWTPIAGASTAAQYGVFDNGTPLGPLGGSSIATVNQSQPPFDYQTIGANWHDLGVFQASSGILTVKLGTDISGYALADAAMIVPYTTPPATEMTMDSLGIDASGNLAVSYTISGEDAQPFSIGIYQSSDGIKPGTLVGSIDLSDPSDLSGGGTTHTAIYQGSLGGLDGGQYYLAQLDAYRQVEQQTRAGTTSSNLSGVYQDGSGDLYVLAANDGSGHSVSISQDSSGDASVALDSGGGQTFGNVGTIYVVTYHGANTINAAGVESSMTIYGGDGSDTITGGDRGNTIHGGTAGGNTIYAGKGNDTIYGDGGSGGGHNTIQGGAGTDTVYAGDGGDTITGGTGNAEIYGGAGHDTLSGGQGNNWIQAGSGDATITGGPGQDWLLGGAGTNWIFGGAGTEKIYGGPGTNYLSGGTGLDDIYGGSGTNYIYGNGVHDLLQGGTGNNFVQPNRQYPPYDLASIEVKDHSNNPTHDGNIDASGSSDLGDYEAAGPGYGGLVDWNFSDFCSEQRLGGAHETPVAVSVSWRNDGTDFTTAGGTTGTQWSGSATYSVLIDGTSVGSTTVDQGIAPNSDFNLYTDRKWQLLGVWYVSCGSALTVELLNGDFASGSVLCAGDVMVHAIWPTVSIRPDIPVNPRAPGGYTKATTGDYIDWVDSFTPVQVPVEGDVERVKLNLSASIETLYYQISTAAAGDWHLVLPNVAGLEFWNAETDGTQLAPDGNSNLVDQSLTTSGYVTTTVWASSDPNGMPEAVSIVAEVTGPSSASVQALCSAEESVGYWTHDDWQNPDVRNVDGKIVVAYKGTATPHGRASLKELAEAITSHADDWKLIAKNVQYDPKTTEVTDDTKNVDITPLLDVLEHRIRDNIVAAAKVGDERFASFPEDGGEKTEDKLSAMNEAAVNNVFNPKDKTATKPIFDCASMADIVFARGLTGGAGQGTVLKPGEFDKYGIHPDNINIIFKPFTKLADTKIGDLVYIENNSHYNDADIHKNGASTGENSIKIGDDLFQSWQGKPMSYNDWIEFLFKEFNDPPTPDSKKLKRDKDGKIPVDAVPGYNEVRGSQFIDIAKLAMFLFGKRARKPPSKT